MGRFAEAPGLPVLQKDVIIYSGKQYTMLRTLNPLQQLPSNCR